MSARSIVAVLAVALCGCTAAAPRGVTAPASAEPRAAVAALPPTPAPPAPLPPGPLGELSRLFTDAYRAERARTRATLEPAIVVAGNDATLYRAGSSTTARVIPDAFHAEKAIAHLPLAIWVTLAPRLAAGGEVDPRELAPILDGIAAADASVVALTGTAEQLARRRRILDGSRRFLGAVGERRRVDAAELAAFARDMGPLLVASSDDAGCLLVRALDAQVDSWRATMSAEEWARLVVVVRASHQARYRNAVTQYFAWKLGAATAPAWSYPGESARVVYAESLRRDDEPLDLGATVALDAAMSRAFLGDSWRLSEDVLSDGAARCVAELAGRPRDRR